MPSASHADDAALNFAGHLINGFRDVMFDPLDPAYPWCF